MVRFTVPNVDAMITAFPEEPMAIAGRPTYEELTKLRSAMYANASSVDSEAGGGSHGHLGMLMEPTVYANVHATAWEDPTPPGALPDPTSRTAAQISADERQHEKHTYAYNVFCNLNKALKKQLVSAIDPLYLASQRDQHSGFARKSAKELLLFLFKNYGEISKQQLQENGITMNTPWNPAEPVEILIKQIDDAVQFATDGKVPYSDLQIVQTAYSLVFGTGMYFDDLKAWDARDGSTAGQETTWVAFKTFITDAHQRLCRQQDTAQKAGFHEANNLRGMTAEDFANMLSEAARAPLGEIHNTMTSENKTMMAALTKALNRIDALEAASKKSGTKTKKDNGGYCWSHGFLVAHKHDGFTCKNPLPGHVKEATRADTMGGSQRGKESIGL